MVALGPRGPHESGADDPTFDGLWDDRWGSANYAAPGYQRSRLEVPCTGDDLCPCDRCRLAALKPEDVAWLEEHAWHDPRPVADIDPEIAAIRWVRG